MVANPQLGIYVRIFPGYTSSTYSASSTITDITSYVRLEEGISLTRGATDETSFPSAGRLSLTLNNRDYRFTPDNTSSSLFPNFKNRIPIRVERSVRTYAISAITKSGSYMIATYPLGTPVGSGYVTITGAANSGNNGAFFVVSATATSVTLLNTSATTEASVVATGVYSVALWTGFVETIEEHWNGGLQATVTITASDILAYYARQKLPSAVTAGQQKDGALVVYPLSDDAGSTSSADASVNGYAPLRRGAYGSVTTATTQTFGVGSFGSDPDQNVLQLLRTSSSVGYYMSANIQIASSSTGTIEGYFYLSGNAMNGVLMRIESGANAYAVHANSPATMVITVLSTGTATTRITGTTTIDDGAWHHVALTWSNSASTTTWTMYVDGTSQGTYAETIASGPAVLRLFIGGSDSATPATCWAANVALYNFDNSGTFADRANAVTGFKELASDRANRVLTIAGTSLYSTNTSAVTMGPQPTIGQNLLDVLQQINDAEDGAIYLLAIGYIYFIDRFTRDTLGTVVTIDPKYLNTGTTLMRAPASVNTVIASRPTGGSVTVSDSVSVAENGVSTETINLYVANDADLYAVAKRRLYRRSVQQSRIGNVEVDLATSTAINDNLLGSDIGTYLSIGPLPRGNVDTLLVRVEGLSDQITPSSWVRTFVTSPAYVNKSGSNWVLGTSILDFTTTLA